MFNVDHIIIYQCKIHVSDRDIHLGTGTFDIGIHNTGDLLL